MVDRLRFIRRKGLCDNCLMLGHLAVSCPMESFCRLSDCKFKHRKHALFLYPKNNVADGSAFGFVCSTHRGISEYGHGLVCQLYEKVYCKKRNLRGCAIRQCKEFCAITSKSMSFCYNEM